MAAGEELANTDVSRGDSKTIKRTFSYPRSLCYSHYFFFFFFSEIYKIVSQKQIRESPDDDNSISANVQTITVAPTDNSAVGKKQCCAA